MRRLSTRRLAIAGLFVWAASGISAQDSLTLPPLNFSGYTDLSLNVLSPDASGGGPETAWTLLGLGAGVVDAVAGAGAQNVKTEMRFSLATYPDPSVVMDRLLSKFRISGFRTTLGLGRVAWGPGFVFAPGDLLFDSTSLSVSLTADELRSSGAWLGDLYQSLGEESFVELAAAAPAAVNVVSNSVSVPYPGALSDAQAGARISGSPGGVGLEAAYAVDGADRLQKVAVSTQVHAGLDWYATLRADLPISSFVDFDGGKALSLGLGGFGLFQIGDGLTFTTRHEVLLRPWHSWNAAFQNQTGYGLTAIPVPAPDSPPGTAGVGLPYALYTYHEFSLTLPDNFAIVLQGLLSPVDLSGVGVLELDWSPLQSLKLYTRVSAEGGLPGDTYAWANPGSLALSLGDHIVF